MSVYQKIQKKDYSSITPEKQPQQKQGNHLYWYILKLVTLVKKRDNGRYISKAIQAFKKKERF